MLGRRHPLRKLCLSDLRACSHKTFPAPNHSWHSPGPLTGSGGWPKRSIFSDLCGFIVFWWSTLPQPPPSAQPPWPQYSVLGSWGSTNWGHACTCILTSLKWCPTLCDSMDCSLHSSSVHGILQERILECIAIPFSRGASRPRDLKPGFLHCKWILYHLSHREELQLLMKSTKFYWAFLLSLAFI